MNIIQVPELTTRLNKRFGIKQRDIAPTLAPEIQPVCLVEDLTVPTSADTQRRFASASNNLVGVAAQTAAMIFKNPANSGINLLIDTLIVFSTFDVGVHIRSPIDEPGTDNITQTSRFLNAALAGSRPVIVVGQETNSNKTPGFGQLFFQGTSTGLEIPVRGALLVPNSSLSVSWISDGGNRVYANVTFSEIPVG